MKFENIKEIMDYLAITKAQENQITPEIAVDIFASPVTDDATNMMQVHRWFDTECDLSLGKIIRGNIDKLYETDLNLYKLRIICNMRGPSTMDEFISTVSKSLTDSTIEKIGKHKDFPTSVKELLYEQTQDPGYLSKDAQDIFVF
jgi:hypothetical protein